MIVVCTRCQAKFRVADEKVGPRGAKVRCSKCQDVFLVHKDLGSVPLGTEGRGPAAAAPPARPASLEIDLEPGRAAARPAPVPPAPDPFAGADPFAVAEAPAPARPPSPEDPFLAASRTAPAAGGRAAVDPFAAAMAGRPSAPDPFGEPGLARPDPFAAPPLMTPAPMAGTPAPIAPPGALPLTDLSDLMGAIPPPEPPITPGDGEASDPDFALDGRAAPRPRVSALEAATEAAEVNVAAAAASRQEHEFYADASEESIGLATEVTGRRPLPPVPPTDAPTPVRGTPAEAPPEPAPARPRPRPPPRDEEKAELAARTIAQHLPRLRRASRLRKIALNALALLVLVIVATGLLILLRSGGKLEPGALRPSAILRALGGETPGAFAAVDVTSGAYERTRGPPLLFVRGRAVSRAAAPVRAVVVSVEVVLRGEVVARGRALAGAVPTPEELAGIADAAALSALERAAGSRAPGQVRPGEEVPFLVAIADYPGDVAGAALRLHVEEAAPEEGR